jgi:SAM-dependent methyltransferase
MSLRNQLLENNSLELRNNIFYQKNLPLNSAFEDVYIKVREQENRIHADEFVSKLPHAERTHPNKKEWDMRRSSLQKLITHLKKNGVSRIMELGCGNGWLSNSLAVRLKAEVCAIDVNETELLQGSKVFGAQQNLCFVYTDIFSETLKRQKFDAIILGSCIQYFQDLKNLHCKLFELMDSTASVYIVDSPFYLSMVESNAAKGRSLNYFKSLGFPEMAEKYFHHTLDELKGFKYKILYNPRSISSLFKRKILKMPLSVFPIICISKEGKV